MNLPNKLTVFRMILIVPFVFVMLSDIFGTAGKWIALALFVIASLTDLLDGKIARKYNLVTNFGKFMDPLADKLLVCAAMICLVETGKIPSWVVIIIISREFIISGFRLIASDNGIVIAASYWGKFKTVFQMVLIMTALLEPVLYEIIFMIFKKIPAGVVEFLGKYPPLTFAAMAGTLLFTVWSCISYFKGTGQYIDPEK